MVLGAGLMGIGGNSRAVAAAAEGRIKEISKTLPPGIYAHTVLNRTQLVDATIHTVASNLGEGALLVIAVLFLMLGNFRAAIITGLLSPPPSPRDPTRTRIPSDACKIKTNYQLQQCTS